MIGIERIPKIRRTILGSFRNGERVEAVSDNVKEGRMKVGWLLFVILELRRETIP
jgi:hypothetical protein